jgi:6-phosphogluconolactonase
VVIGAAIEECIADRGRCSIALSRPTPSEVFEAVNEVRIPRRNIDLFQVDERIAKRGTEDRNLTLIERDLDRWVDAMEMHAMPVDNEINPRRAAARYEDVLVDVCGRPPELDLVHLGLGPDGHTASLLPGDPVLDVTDHSVWFARPKGGIPRVTLTYPTLDAARLIVVVASGEEKADAVRGVLSGDQTLPAARLNAPNIRFYIDAAAASRL